MTLVEELAELVNSPINAAGSRRISEIYLELGYQQSAIIWHEIYIRELIAGNVGGKVLDEALAQLIRLMSEPLDFLIRPTYFQLVKVRIFTRPALLFSCEMWGSFHMVVKARGWSTAGSCLRMALTLIGIADPLNLILRAKHVITRRLRAIR